MRASERKHMEKIKVYEDWIRRACGLPRYRVEEQLAAKYGISAATVRRYIRDIAEYGYQPPLRPRQGRKIFAWDKESLTLLKAFYLSIRRDAGHCTVRNAYNKTVEAAREKGLKVGSEQSAYTHIRDIHSLLQTYASGGARALDNVFYIARDLSRLAPLQVIVGDQHTFDYWVLYNGKYIRPQCYLWLDMRTRLVYGVDFEPGAYNYRNVSRSLKMGIIRFGKFGSTYNDNGAAERSFRIDRLVNALQTYGMSYQDSADLYRTQNGQYVVEDIQGEVVAEVPNLKEWRKENRRMFAQVKNAKAKPIERFFHTLEVLLSDLVLPGYVRDITASAPEDEEATRRLTWQKEQGYILSYDEFIGKVKDAIIRYENRNHAGLKRSPLEELRYAQEKEGWAPSWLDSDDIRHLFLERDNRIVKGNRVRIEGFYYLGPELTQDMVRENRHNLAGLSGLKVEVFYDPDDPAAGAWAVDPRSGETIYLTPEERIDPFNSEEVSQQLKSKRSSMRAVSSSFRETTAAAGKVLTSPEYKPRIEAQSVANKAIEAKTEKAALVSSMSNEEFTAAVAVSNRIAKEQRELVKRKAVYPTPMKRYQAILDIILRGENLSSGDRLFKAEYESRMGPEEKTKWNIYINFNQGVKHGLK